MNDLSPIIWDISQSTHFLHIHHAWTWQRSAQTVFGFVSVPQQLLWGGHAVNNNNNYMHTHNNTILITINRKLMIYMCVLCSPVNNYANGVIQASYEEWKLDTRSPASSQASWVLAWPVAVVDCWAWEHGHFTSGAVSPHCMNAQHSSLLNSTVSITFFTDRQDLSSSFFNVSVVVNWLLYT